MELIIVRHTFKCGRTIPGRRYKSLTNRIKPNIYIDIPQYQNGVIAMNASRTANCCTKKESSFRRTMKNINNSKYLLLLLLPSFIYFVIFKYWPMFGLVISFNDYNLFKGIMESPRVGFKHYANFIQDAI